MKTINHKTYCSYTEFEQEFNQRSYPSDTLTDGYYYGQEAYLWKNSAGCLLGVWIKETEEYIVL